VLYRWFSAEKAASAFNDFLAVNMLMNNARESAAIDRNA
jgi:hypothetical protein